MAENRNGLKWSREETILAFELYCRTPFGKISQSNADIIELATLLGRTPGSVGLKMHNLAHYDPELQKRNVTAMAHGSKLDGEVYAEFAKNWTELSFQAQAIRAKMENKSIAEVVDVGSSFPKSLRTRIAWRFRASIERKRGVFLSRASPP